ncbi:TIGR01777 family oxidoreductase [Arundinibacter roseus]|uniref:TIGR01777 family protein n=1 Tax=Arundinibacter roseus TaxID=2070510 RepID=A0A4R4JY39_9BACT|nr:TIGR01777 family oxidoreductase [Arundinibacter roseus]TDB59837.1 TIGR01777 family protein [Arundinibacter roseus]
MSKKVLITGGSGLIGQRLTDMLLERGYRVAHLSRSGMPKPNISVYEWDIKKGMVDPRALDSMDYLIHLAGAGIADERWTESRKKEIISSRTESIELLARLMKAQEIKPQAFVSSSAIGYYGADTGQQKHTEQSPAGNDFLADVTKKWEDAADAVAALNIRTVKLRTGVVLSEKGGALAKMATPARLGAGAPLGSGTQWMSWIHLDDMCRLFIEALENDSWTGVYNGVSATPVTNTELTHQICKVLGRPQWLPNVPEFALRLAFGEMADVVLGSSYVQNTRVQQSSFRYEFPELTQALVNLLSKK